MLDLIKLTVGITVILGILLAIPVFAYVLGAGLALVVLFECMKDFTKENKP
jgi:hypothetical protein